MGTPGRSSTGGGVRVSGWGAVPAGGRLGGAVAPVGAPLLLLDGPRLLGGELRSVLPRDLHRVVLRHLVFVLRAPEKAALWAEPT